MHHMPAAMVLILIFQVRPGFQGQSQTEIFTSLDMAEHLVYPNTADAVSQGFGPFQEPVCWQFVTLDVCDVDQMAQGTWEQGIVLTCFPASLLDLPCEDQQTLALNPACLSCQSRPCTKLAYANLLLLCTQQMVISPTSVLFRSAQDALMSSSIVSIGHVCAR